MSTSTSTAGPAAGRAACEPRTAFVLAGGAALGAMQAGMIHALYERGIAPDLLIGTSAGALNAAFLASRPATVATVQELAAVWRGLRRSDILPLRPATLISALAGRRDHLIPDRALRRLAARHLQFERLEQAAIPLHLVAFDLLAGTEVRLSDGPLADAVLAAAAIPGVLPPVRWRGRLLADGGIADNTPVSHAVALGARRIYVLPTQNPGDRGLPRPPRAALAAAVHAVTVLTNARLHGDLARYAPSAELIVLPAANPGHTPPTDLRLRAVIDNGDFETYWAFHMRHERYRVHQARYQDRYDLLPDRTGHCRRATPLSVRWMSPCLVTGRVVVPEPVDLLRDAGSRHAWPACPLVAPVARRVSPAPPPWRCPIFARSCRSARWTGQRPR